MATTSGAVAAAAARVRRLIVGGILAEVNRATFLNIIERTKGVVIKGIIGIFNKKKLYLTVADGITFYCKVDMDDELPITAIETEKINTGGLI